MKYLFLVYADKTQHGMNSTSDRSTFDQECRGVCEALRESGYLLDSLCLPSGSPATTVRVQRGKLVLSDGSLPETGDPLAALYFVSARDLNEAIRIASKMPQAQRGAIEVRAVEDCQG